MARSLKTEVAFFVSGNRNKEFSFQDGGRRGRTCESHATTPGEEAEPGFRIAVGETRCIETVAETPGKSGKNLGQEDTWCLQAKLYRIPLARKRENTLRRNPSKS